MIAYVNTGNKGTLNMRAEPSTSARILAQIPYGTEIEVTSLIDEWTSTSYKGSTGYVMCKFLSEKTNSTITKASLEKIYNSLKTTLKTIEEVLK